MTKGWVLCLVLALGTVAACGQGVVKDSSPTPVVPLRVLLWKIPEDVLGPAGAPGSRDFESVVEAVKRYTKSLDNVLDVNVLPVTRSVVVTYRGTPEFESQLEALLTPVVWEAKTTGEIAAEKAEKARKEKELKDRTENQLRDWITSVKKINYSSEMLAVERLVSAIGGLQTQPAESLVVTADKTIIYSLSGAKEKLLMDYLTRYDRPGYEILVLVKAYRATSTDMYEITSGLEGLTKTFNSAADTLTVDLNKRTDTTSAQLMVQYSSADFEAYMQGAVSEGKATTVTRLDATAYDGDESEILIESVDTFPVFIAQGDGAVTTENAEAGARLKIRSPRVVDNPGAVFALRDLAQASGDWLKTRGAEIQAALARLDAGGDSDASPADARRQRFLLQVEYENKMDQFRNTREGILRLLTVEFDYEVEDGGFTSIVESTTGEQAPYTSRTENQGKARIVSNHTMVFAGHRDNTRSDSYSGIPFLGQIPLLRILFGKKTREGKDVETLFTASVAIKGNDTDRFLYGNYVALFGVLNETDAVIDHPLRDYSMPRARWLNDPRKDRNGQYRGAVQRALCKVRDNRELEEVGRIWRKHIIAPLSTRVKDKKLWLDYGFMKDQVRTLDTYPGGLSLYDRMQAAVAEVNATIPSLCGCSQTLTAEELLALARYEGRLGGVTKPCWRKLWLGREREALICFMRRELQRESKKRCPGSGWF